MRDPTRMLIRMDDVIHDRLHPDGLRRLREHHRSSGANGLGVSLHHAEVGTDDSRNCIWYVFLLVSNLTLMYSPLPEPPVYVVV